MSTTPYVNDCHKLEGQTVRSVPRAVRTLCPPATTANPITTLILPDRPDLIMMLHPSRAIATHDTGLFVARHPKNDPRRVSPADGVHPNLLQGSRRRARKRICGRSERVVERVHGSGRELIVNDPLADELMGGHVREVEVELERAEGGEWGEGFGEVFLRAVTVRG